MQLQAEFETQDLYKQLVLPRAFACRYAAASFLSSSVAAGCATTMPSAACKHGCIRYAPLPLPSTCYT